MNYESLMEKKSFFSRIIILLVVLFILTEARNLNVPYWCLDTSLAQRLKTLEIEIT